METARTTPLFYQDSLALLTDYYQITTAYAYWKAGIHEKEAVFHMFFRKQPFGGAYAIAAGLESVVDYFNRFKFEQGDLDYLATLKGADGSDLFDPRFFDYLAKMEFSCHMDAVPEGTPVFPFEPLVRVQGPLLQCQLVETPLLNLINFPTLIATKAARIRIAAQGDFVSEFGLRRAQGVDGGITASRSAYIGGCDGTSNLLAGKLFGIPVGGTQPHSWIMVFDDELDAFDVYAKQLPNNCTFLVDTYNTLEGVKKAIQVGKKLRAQGKEFLGLRLDSGDLAYLSIKARKLLDEAGFVKANIIASNELDEHLIHELKRQGAMITIWGVGTNLVTGKEQPALDGVYKLSAVRDPGKAWQYKLKLSEQMVKISNPGILQVRRFSSEEGNVADVIFDINLGCPEVCEVVDPFDSTRRKLLSTDLSHIDLLVPVFRGGKSVYKLPLLQEIRSRTQSELALFHSSIKRYVNPHQYIVGMERKLYDIKVALIHQIREHKAQSLVIPQKQRGSP